ncbi:type I-E CRISPR-associated protein Cse2/CasB [Kitasatospora sp. NPDC092286]|uniref:type I-E CRISPR-associated protein Cse2/CasB n=1 Tax=Kitasatospora sp. NPDC092286 TaxID=3364087 RepID=UPI00380F01DB
MTTYRPPVARRLRDLGRAGDAAHHRIAELQHGYRADRADAVAAVARIRRGAGKPADGLPELWGLTGLERLYPDGRTGPSDTAAENAVHAAVTLWSLHQQAHREAGMHHPRGLELGAAVRRLMPADDIDEPLRKRFVRAGSAISFDILAQRLREIVLLLRREAVPLDYGLLADRLHLWQLPTRRGEVNRAWGRSFHSYRPPRDPANDPTDAAATNEQPLTDPTDTTMDKGKD